MAYGASASTVLTLLGFCVSVLFIVFVCSRLACALAARRRRQRRQRRSAPPGVLPQYAVATTYAFFPVAVPRHPAAAAGLDPAAIAAFPTRAFVSSDADSSPDADDAQCVVCLAEYEDKDMLRFLPYCGHDFHMACIDLWLEQNSTCPVCRISLRGNPENSHITPPPPSVVISPPCSPQASGSDPYRCLFVSTGHSSRASSEVPRHEPDQENQVSSGPAADEAANNLPLSEVNPSPENNGQAVSKKAGG